MLAKTFDFDDGHPTDAYLHEPTLHCFQRTNADNCYDIAQSHNRLLSSGATKFADAGNGRPIITRPHPLQRHKGPPAQPGVPGRLRGRPLADE